MAVLVPFLAALLGPGLLFLGLVRSRRRWLVEDTPTVPAGRAFAGAVEVVGMAEPPAGSPWLVSPVTGDTCAYRSVTLEQRSDRRRDDGWAPRRRWVTGPFVVRDGSGALLVDPHGAALDAVRVEVHGVERLDPALPVGALVPVEQRGPEDPGAPARPGEPGAPRRRRGPWWWRDDRRTVPFRGDRAPGGGRPLGDLEGSWRVREAWIPMGAPVVIHGPAVPDPGGLPRLVLRSHGGRRVRISIGAEADVLRRLWWGTRVPVAVGVLGCGVLAALLARGLPAPLAPRAADVPVPPFASWASTWFPWLPVGWWFAGLAVLGAQAVRVRNRAVALREQVVMAWRMIDVATARRAALVPTMLAAAGGAATHEHELVEAIAALRTLSDRARGDEPTDVRLGAAADAHLLARYVQQRLESLPALVAGRAFAALRASLDDAEDAVAVARGYYVEARRLHAERIARWPDRWLVDRRPLPEVDGEPRPTGREVGQPGGSERSSVRTDAWTAPSSSTLSRKS